MGLRSVRWARGNVSPIQSEACQVHKLDLFPQAKPVQTTFEPVMIAGHNQKQDDEGDERAIACLIPSCFVEGYRADYPDNEEDETPSGHGRTRGSGQGDHAVKFLDQACQRVGFRNRRGGLFLGHRADLTGRGRVRQLSSRMMSEGWMDVQIRTNVEAGELLARLADPAIQGGWEDNGVLHLYWPKPEWTLKARA